MLVSLHIFRVRGCLKGSGFSVCFQKVWAQDKLPIRLVSKVVPWFYGRTIVVTEPIRSIKLDIGNSEVPAWVSFDLTISSIAHEGAFIESFGTFAAVTSSLKLGCLPNTFLNNLGGEKNTRPSGAFGRR